MRTHGYIAMILLGFLMPAVLPLAAQQEPPLTPKGQPPHELIMKDRPFPPEAPPLPGLTDEQKEKIRKLNLENDKQNLPVENNIAELEAKMRSVTTGDNASYEQASKLIDEISGLRAKVMKNNIRTHLEIRKLLNDEQKVIFDRKPPLAGKMFPEIKKKEKMK